jgi:flagellar motor switch protein FliN/FliY
MSNLTETIEQVGVNLEVVLGAATMPVHQLLRMGRGAIIELDARESDDVLVVANDVPIARASVVVDDGRISVEITHMLPRPTKLRA